MSNATTTERHPIPPIVCTPGCEYGDGRPDALFRGDKLVGDHGAMSICRSRK